MRYLSSSATCELPFNIHKVCYIQVRNQRAKRKARKDVFFVLVCVPLAMQAYGELR